MRPNMFRGRLWAKGNVGGALDMGNSADPLVLTEGTPRFTLYTTCASVHASTNAEPFLVYTTMTGAAAVGGRAKFYMTTNVALGGWSNALKAEVVYGASGRTTGLGSAFCAELTVSAGTTGGTYAPLESELVCNTNGSTGVATSFLFGNVSGTAKATLNEEAYLFHLGENVVTTTDGLFEVINADDIDVNACFKVRVASVDYFIPASTVKTFDA